MSHRVSSLFGNPRSIGRRRARRAYPCVEGFEARLLLAAPDLTVSDASVLANPDGTVTIDFTVSIDLNLETNVTVYYYTTDGADGVDCVPAVSGIDYFGVPQDSPLSVTFPINSTTETVSILVPGNYQISPTKCFTLHAFRTDTQPQLDASGVGSILNENSLVVSNTNNSGYGSLFGAIQSVNTSDLSGVPTIRFAITGQSIPAPFTIFPDTPLPALERPASIDATTQPGYSGKPLVILDGSRVSDDGLPDPNADALVLNALNSEVHGLAIQNWTRDGIRVNGFQQTFTTALTGHTAVISRNEITNVGGAGVNDLSDGGNTIQANTFKGIGGDGVALGGGSNNLVASNQILEVLGSGISVQAGSSQTTLTNNTISDVGGSGILLASGSGYTVQGNAITRPGGAGIFGKGLSAGSLIRSNMVTAAGDAGISVSDGSGVSILTNTVTNPASGGIVLDSYRNGTLRGNTIAVAPNAGGVEAPPARSSIALARSVNNTIDGNNVNGSLLAGIELADASNGNRLTRNTVASAASSGLLIDGSSGNMVSSNTFGLAGRGNGEDGVTILGPSKGNLVGMPGAGNAVLANALVGIRLGDCSEGGPSGNVVQGNTIGAGVGTAPTGKGDRNRANGPSRSGLGNESGGIFLDSASGNVIGGAGTAANVVADNGGPGVQITLGSRNVVVGNLIGLTTANGPASGNALDGVFIDRSTNNQVVGNTVSGNGLVGVRIAGPSGANGPDGVGPNAANNQVVGNRIGTNTAGTTAVGNVFGGVFLVFAAPSNRFLNNVISGNGQSGVVLSGPGARGNVFAGNMIGVNAAGAAGLANALDGVFLSNAGGNTIGLPGQGNVIASRPATGSGASASGGSAVQVFGAAGSGNLVQSNRINLSVAGRPIFPGAVGVFLNQAGTNTVVTRGTNANLFGNPAPLQVVTVNSPGRTRTARSSALLLRNRLASVTVS